MFKLRVDPTYMAGTGWDMQFCDADEDSLDYVKELKDKRAIRLKSAFRWLGTSKIDKYRGLNGNQNSDDLITR
ncbi:hypothetical protein OUZ56_025154 [Daphnia magna]|uniref:Uncharacterized protein n=1 Tax=Daphnia magna TaxID=35525 RepID=A0ABQ9ZJ05_9CRUS|nr:hypothetical protein OUZ56_025154 [Daphnia magna]